VLISSFESKLVYLSIGIVLLALAVRGIYILAMALASLNWTRIEGLVLDAHMEEYDFRENDDNSFPKVRYSYIVASKTYESTRVWYRTDPFFDYSQSLLAIRDVHVRKQVYVYYDPSKPSRSVLIPGFEVNNVASVIISTIAFVAFIGWRIFM
jgi:hypothetical protein